MVSLDTKIFRGIAVLLSLVAGVAAVRDAPATNMLEAEIGNEGNVKIANIEPPGTRTLKEKKSKRKKYKLPNNKKRSSTAFSNIASISSSSKSAKKGKTTTSTTSKKSKSGKGNKSSTSKSSKTSKKGSSTMSSSSDDDNPPVVIASTADFSSATVADPLILFTVAEVGNTNTAVEIIVKEGDEVFVAMEDSTNNARRRSPQAGAACPPFGGVQVEFTGSTTVIQLFGIDTEIVVCSGGFAIGYCYYAFDAPPLDSSGEAPSFQETFDFSSASSAAPVSYNYQFGPGVGLDGTAWIVLNGDFGDWAVGDLGGFFLAPSSVLVNGDPCPTNDSDEELLEPDDFFPFTLFYLEAEEDQTIYACDGGLTVGILACEFVGMVPTTPSPTPAPSTSATPSADVGSTSPSTSTAPSGGPSISTSPSIVTEPSATEPSATEPSATEPSVTEPSATEPSVTEPSVTEPSVTEPSATEPIATEPIATEPSATEPSVTEPSVTEPSTSAAPSTSVAPSISTAPSGGSWAPSISTAPSISAAPSISTAPSSGSAAPSISVAPSSSVAPTPAAT